jgi:ribosome-associated toxin RatA of RatAB toxin-antitoxin module
MFVPRLLTGGALLLALIGSAQARPGLDAARLDALGRYEVLTFEDPAGGGIERGKAIGVIDATTEEVFRIATDYARYADFMPRVVSSRVKELASDHALVELTADLKWPAGVSTVTARYQYQKLPNDTFRVTFDKVDGSLKQYVGALYIEPFAPGKTAITYELVAVPDTIAPKSAINRGVRRSTGNFVNALRQRINELHRLGFLHPLAKPSPSTKTPISAVPPTIDLKAHR